MTTAALDALPRVLTARLCASARGIIGTPLTRCASGLSTAEPVSETADDAASVSSPPPVPRAELELGADVEALLRRLRTLRVFAAHG